MDCDLPEEDIQSFAAYTLGPIRIVHADGIWMWDSDGNRYIDGNSGTFNLPLGHNHPVLMRHLRETIGREPSFVSSAFQTDSSTCLMMEIARITPPSLTRVNLRSSGGSTANEGAIKIAQRATGRRGVVSMFRSHLGQTLAMHGYGGYGRPRETILDLPTASLNVPDPYCGRCFYNLQPSSCEMHCVRQIDEFVKYGGAGVPACIIIEPISGVGGTIIPPPGYLQELRDYCTKRNIVLIFDENQTSLGRTGQMFAADTFDIQPDIMTFSKPLSGLGLSIAAIVTTDELAVLERGDHSFTFGGVNLVAASALKTIEIIDSPGFLENVRSVGKYLRDRLSERLGSIQEVYDVRGIGLMLGIELAHCNGEKNNGLAVSVHKAMLSHGLVTRVSEHGNGNTIELRPPLIVNFNDADEIVDKCVASIEDEVLLSDAP